MYLIIEIIPRLSSPVYEIETLKIKINYQRLANYYSNHDTFVKLPYDKFNSSEIFKNLLSPFHRQCFLGNLDSQPSIIRPAKNKEILHYNSPSLYFVSTPVAGIVYPLSPSSLVSVSIAIHGILSHFFLPPPPSFPDISYRAVSWKGRFYIFLVDSLPRIIWLDAILNCAFPIILSRLWYSMRNACSLLFLPLPLSGVHERLSMEIFGELKSRYYTFWRRRIYLNLFPFNKAIRIQEYIEKLRRFLRSR